MGRVTQQMGDHTMYASNAFDSFTTEVSAGTAIMLREGKSNSSALRGTVFDFNIRENLAVAAEKAGGFAYEANVVGRGVDEYGDYRGQGVDPVNAAILAVGQRSPGAA